MKKSFNWPRTFLVIGFLAFGLGIWGFTTGKDLSWLNLFRAFLNTIQMYILNLSSDAFFVRDSNGNVLNEFLNWQVVTAAILAPLSTIGAVIAAFGAKLNRWWVASVLLWIKPADYIFIGGGETAAGIVTRLKAREVGCDFKIVGLDLRQDCPLAHSMYANRIKGFMHYENALTDEQLNKLELHRTGNIWISTGTDLQNIEIARRVIDVINKRNIEHKQSQRIRLCVHVRDYHLNRLQETLFPGLAKSMVILEMVSINRAVAREILRDHPPLLIKSQKVPHVLIVGDSELASSLALHVVQHCIYDEHEPVKITLASNNAQAMLKILRQKFIALDEINSDPAIQALLPLANFQTIDCDVDELSSSDWAKAQNGQNFNVVYVACEQDEQTLSATLRAAALREITPNVLEKSQPIYACFNRIEATSLQKYIKVKVEDELEVEGVYGIDIYNSIIKNNDSYYGESQDRRAMFINAFYDSKLRLEEGQELNDAFRLKRNIEASQLWEKQADKGAYRWSSRLSADHIQIKLESLKINDVNCVPTIDDIEKISNEINKQRNLQKLNRLEHRRFVVERLLEGWLPIDEERVGPKGYSKLDKANQKKILLVNHTLVPFDELDDSEAVKDSAIVKAIPEILRCEILMATKESKQGFWCRLYKRFKFCF